MSNLAAVLHNLIDAIEDGDMDEIRSAAKLAKLAAPSPDTPDTPAPLTVYSGLPGVPPEATCVVYDNDTQQWGWFTRPFPDGNEQEAANVLDDKLGGSWYVYEKQWSFDPVACKGDLTQHI